MNLTENSEFIKIYWLQYKLLEKRMIELSDYVSIDKKNYSTFSNQFIFLFLTICSEIDSVADKLCSLLDISSKDRYGINSKINNIIIKYNNLKNWKCNTKFPYDGINIVPFQKFDSENNISSDWWQAYNKVKHFRTDCIDGMYNYELANLKNILYSLSALYLLICKIKNEFCSDSALNMNSDLFDIDVSSFI